MVEGDALDRLPAERPDPPARDVVERPAVEIEQGVDGDLRAAEDLLDDRPRHHRGDGLQPVAVDLVGVLARAAGPRLDEHTGRELVRRDDRRDPGSRDPDPLRAEGLARQVLVHRGRDEPGVGHEHAASDRLEPFARARQDRQVRVDGRHDEPDGVALDRREQVVQVSVVTGPKDPDRVVGQEQRRRQAIDVRGDEPGTPGMRGIHERLDQAGPPSGRGDQDMRRPVVGSGRAGVRTHAAVPLRCVVVPAVGGRPGTSGWSRR